MRQTNIRNDLYVWKSLSEFSEPHRKQLRSKMVNDSHSESTGLFRLRDTLGHFLTQIQKPTRIAKNNLSFMAEFERLGGSPEKAAVQLLLQPLDLKSNPRLRDMQPL